MAIEGVSLALDDPVLEADPTWTRIDDDEGLRVASWQIRRGRSFELDRMESGTCEIAINDRNGVLDPTNPSSPYYGLIEPRIQVGVALPNPMDSSWNTRYRGYIEDFDYVLHPSQKVMQLRLSCVDMRTLLSNMELAPGLAGDTPPPASTGFIFYDNANVDDRILQAAADAGIPAGLLSIFSGNVALLEAKYSAGENIMTVMDDAADAEFPGVAVLYVDRLGVLRFRGRLTRFDYTNPSYGVGQWKAGDGAAVHDSISDTAQIRGFTFNRGMSKIRNAALAYPQGIAQSSLEGQLATDSPSITQYGLASWTAPNLLIASGLLTDNDGNDESKMYAQWVVDNFKAPRNRISQVVFKSLRPDDPRAEANWNLICGVELGDYIEVTVSHPGDGGFSLEPCFVEGITEEASPMTPAYHNVTTTLDLSPRAYFETNPFPTS